MTAYAPTTACSSTWIRDKRIATITFNNPKQRNSYDAAMRDAVARCLDGSPRTTTSPWCCCAAPTACSPPART